MAVWAPRDGNGCTGGRLLRGHPGFCVTTSESHVCVMTGSGAFWCSHYADGAPPFRNENATTNARGVLRLEVPPPGTHATPPLPWHRYPHVDGYIEPWTSTGSLRRGLTFGPGPVRGTCSPGSEVTRARAALRCLSAAMDQYAACFPRAADWNRRGAVVACGDAGSTRFFRFVITRREP